MKSSSSSSSSATTKVSSSTTLVDEEIPRLDSDTTEFDPFQKVLELLESMETTLVEHGADLKEIKKRLRIMETNLEFVRQSQISEAGRLTRLESDCERCAGKFTPLPSAAKKKPPLKEGDCVDTKQ